MITRLPVAVKLMMKISIYLSTLKDSLGGLLAAHTLFLLLFVGLSV